MEKDTAIGHFPRKPLSMRVCVGVGGEQGVCIDPTHPDPKGAFHLT